MTSGPTEKHVLKKKSVCVIHTGAEEVFTFERLVGYGGEYASRYVYSEVIDELRALTGVELEGLRENLTERMAHEDYIMLLAGENTSRLSGQGLQALLIGLYMRRPVIVVNLDGCRHCDPSKLPAVLEGRLFLCISSEFPVLEYALDSWRDESFRLTSMEKVHAAVYPSDLYDTLLPDDSAPGSGGLTESIAL